MVSLWCQIYEAYKQNEITEKLSMTIWNHVKVDQKRKKKLKYNPRIYHKILQNEYFSNFNI